MNRFSNDLSFKIWLTSEREQSRVIAYILDPAIICCVVPRILDLIWWSIYTCRPRTVKSCQRMLRRNSRKRRRSKSLPRQRMAPWIWMVRTPSSFLSFEKRIGNYLLSSLLGPMFSLNYCCPCGAGSMEEDASDLNVDIEYVADAMIDPSDPLYSDWIKVRTRH